MTRSEDHFSRLVITRKLKQPTHFASRMTRISSSHSSPPGQCFLRNLFGLAPNGVYRVSLVQLVSLVHHKPSIAGKPALSDPPKAESRRARLCGTFRIP